MARGQQEAAGWSKDQQEAVGCLRGLRKVVVLEIDERGVAGAERAAGDWARGSQVVAVCRRVKE